MREPQPWRVTNSQVLLDESPWLRIVRDRVELPNGIVIDDYLLAQGRDYSMIVAVDENEGVILVRQYKHGFGRVITEFPAGYIEPGEEPLQAAKRELREETGVVADSWTALGSFCLDPSRGTTAAHLFLAKHLAHKHTPALDSTEDLVAIVASRSDVDELLSRGEMPTLACAAIWGLASAALRRDSGAS